MNRYVAVIDLGKTNSKLALVDTQLGSELDVIKQHTAPSSESLYPSLDVDNIEGFINDAMRQFVKAHRIDAITVTTHGATVALVAESGQLSLPVMDYEFSDIDSQRDKYDAVRPSFAETGSPALPGGLNIGAQLFWQATNLPKQFAKTKSVLTWPQYWVFKLTGQRFNDVTSLGCHSDLYNPTEQQYSELVYSQNWVGLMPALSKPGQLCGALTSSFASNMGLPQSTPVYTGIHDSNASLVPHLVARTAPFSVVSTGTWFISMSIGGKTTTLDESRDTLINVSARGETVPSARFMGGREREILNVSEPVTEDEMQRFLALGDSALMLMPSVVPNTGPYPNNKSQWLGASDDQGANMSACAATLYLALMTHECLLLIGAEGPIYIEGPLANDTQYASMLSATSGRSVYLSRSETGTSVGAAMLINRPEHAIEQTLVTVQNDKRKDLEQYAVRWKQQLSRTA